jgi:hypothetical protein
LESGASAWVVGTMGDSEAMAGDGVWKGGEQRRRGRCSLCAVEVFGCAVNQILFAFSGKPRAGKSEAIEDLMIFTPGSYPLARQPAKCELVRGMSSIQYL